MYIEALTLSTRPQDSVRLSRLACWRLTDGRDECRVEGILGEAEQNAGLAHSRVADQQQLEQVVVGFGHCVTAGKALVVCVFV